MHEKRMTNLEEENFLKTTCEQPSDQGRGCGSH